MYCLTEQNPMIWSSPLFVSFTYISSIYKYIQHRIVKTKNNLFLFTSYNKKNTVQVQTVIVLVCPSPFFNILCYELILYLTTCVFQTISIMMINDHHIKLLGCVNLIISWMNFRVSINKALIMYVVYTCYQSAFF